MSRMSGWRNPLAKRAKSPPPPPPPPYGDEPPQDEYAREQRKKGLLAASTLRFRRIACDTLDGMLIHMLTKGTDAVWGEFKTPNGRPCLLILGVGEDVVTTLQHLTNPGPEEEDDQTPAF